MDPLVSVVIPTHNRADLLPRAIRSIVAQSYAHWEIVLVDDGSTDGTTALIAGWQRELGGDRLAYLRRKNEGSSAARNAGIVASRGEFVAFLDSDDEFLPDKLRRQLTLFERRPQLGLVYSDFSFVDFDQRVHPSVFRSKFPLAHETPSEEIAPGLRVCVGSLFDTLIRGYFVATITGMVRREVLGEHVRFNPEVRYAEEWLFYLDVARRCPCGFVDEPLARHHYVHHSLARISKSRNKLARLQLLQRAEQRFDGVLNAAQRRDLHERMAAAARQLAYDAEADGDRLHAAQWSLEAARHQPGPAAWRDLARSTITAGAALLRPREKGTVSRPRESAAVRQPFGFDARAPHSPFLIRHSPFPLSEAPA